jgi:hypothetical protein
LRLYKLKINIFINNKNKKTMKTAKLFLSPLRRAKSRRDGTLLTVCFSLRAILLLALAFFSCADLHAQVTIGGTDIPKNGAILDLNSTAKGGLVLSNVSLVNLDKIPASFPGASGANVTALNEGLTGAMIYNTNPAFCTGVHLWDGLHWGRITAATPLPAPGTLSITSNTVTLLGGDPVEFTAASGAKIYKWYASINNAPYGCLGITTTPTFTEIFPADACKVKVIMDDCYSLNESNEVSFSPGSVSPNFGSLNGDNYIYIYGDFPYAASSDYEQEGLLAMWDAIDNTGQGDKYHNNTATTWKDLTGHGYDGTLFGGTWNGNSLVFDGIDDYVFLPDALDIQLPATVEGVTKTSTDDNGIMFYDKNLHTSFGYFKTISRFMGGGAISLKRPTYIISSSFNNAITTLSMQYGTNFPSEIQFTMNGIIVPPDYSVLNSWEAGDYHNNIGRRDNSVGTLAPYYLKGNIFCLRIYDRELNDVQLAHNAGLDQKRYLAPPTVTIDGKLCTEVVVLSDHFLMCKVPPGTTGTGQKNVVVDGIAYSGAYKYVDPDIDFYINSISPIIGSATQELTLTGKRLDEIDTVMAGGVLCSPVSQSPTEYKCILPSNPPGEVDITIKLNDDTVYRFARVFEYR